MSEFDEFMPFVEAMEAEYLRHYPEKGDSWKKDKSYRLAGSSDAYPQYINQDGYLRGLLAHCYRKYGQTKDPSELLDMANLCAMLWLRSTGVQS